MRILAITNLYPGPGRELIAAFNRQQFAALARLHSVRVIAPLGWPSALADRLRGRRIHGPYRNADGIETEHPAYYYPPRVMRHRYGSCYLRSIRSAAERAINAHHPDVLLSCWAHPDGWATVELGRQFGLPVVIKAIGSDLLIAAQDARRRARISEALGAAGVVVTVSRDLARHAELLGAEPARVRVVPEGIDDELFSPGDRREARARLRLPAHGANILFVGNLLWTKGVGLLVEACRRLANRRVPFHCYFVGRGSSAEKLRSLIHDRGLRDRMTLVGACAHPRLVDWYRAADVVALPSCSEGIPNVLREAISCGTPFVATRVGGIPEIAHPSYSRLVRPGDAEDLAEALQQTLASPPAVDAALVRACNVSCDRSAELLIECLRHATVPTPNGAAHQPSSNRVERFFNSPALAGTTNG